MAAGPQGDRGSKKPNIPGASTPATTAADEESKTAGLKAPPGKFREFRDLKPAKKTDNQKTNGCCSQQHIHINKT